MFNPVQLGYGGMVTLSSLLSTALLSMLDIRVLLCTMDDMTVIKYGHRTTLREHPMKVEELVVKS